MGVLYPTLFLMGVQENKGNKIADFSNTITRVSKNVTEWLQNWSSGLKIGANRGGSRPGPFPSPPPPSGCGQQLTISGPTPGRVGPGSGTTSTISGPNKLTFDSFGNVLDLVPNALRDIIFSRVADIRVPGCRGPGQVPGARVNLAPDTSAELQRPGR